MKKGFLKLFLNVEDEVSKAFNQNLKMIQAKKNKDQDKKVTKVTIKPTSTVGVLRLERE